MVGFKKYRSLAQIASFLITGMIASSCGSSPDVKGVEKKKASEDATSPTADESEDVEFDHLVVPPQEYYDTLFAETVGNADKKEFGLAGAEQVLWVNFDGANVVKGFSKTQSFIPCKQNSVIPAPQISPADKQTILDSVQAHYNSIGALLKVTAERPSAGDFTTIHVGGSFSDLGCVGGGVLGIAPFDQGNSNRNDIGFAFTKGTNNNRIIAETISHEAGHSFGLDHVESRKDLMFASSTNEITGFTVSRVARGTKIQDAPAILKSVLGDGTAVAGTVSTNTPTPVVSNPQSPTPVVPGIAIIPSGLANLPGLNQIGNLGQLIPGISQVGPLDINTLLAQAIAVIPAGAGNTNLPQFDKVLAAIGLAAQAGANQSPAGAAGAVGNIASLAGGILSNPTVSTFANIAALAGLGVGGPVAVTGIQAILNGISGTTAQQPTSTIPALPAGLPDLSTLLGLVNQSTTNPALINNLLNSVKLVNSNFTGTTQAALISMLKVSYSQAYKQINSK